MEQPESYISRVVSDLTGFTALVKIYLDVRNEIPFNI